MKSKLLFLLIYLAGIHSVCHAKARIARQLSTPQVSFNLPHALAVNEPVGSSKSIFLEVKGKVLSEENEGLPGANVLLKGTSRGTVTDVDGRFSIEVPNGEGILVFSSIGYVTQEIPVNNRSTIEVRLQADVKALSEVVVVGYGTQERKDITGSVASVSAEELKQVPIVSLDQGIQGRVSGVQVTQTSGRPGGGVSIRIRGASSINGGNEPLYVIDGFPIYNDNRQTDPGGVRGAFNPPNALASINPNDIESIEILKDASATAIYGSRGANGVVLITTKRGQAGELKVDFESYYGWQSLREKVDLLSAEEFLQFDREARENAGLPLIFPETPPAETDWQDLLYQTAPQQNYQLSLSGGNEKTRFAVSANYFDQEGIILNSGFKRGSLRANIDNTFNDKLKVGLNFTVTHSVNNGANTDAHGGGQDGNGLTLFGVLKTVPVESPYDENGNLTRFSPYTLDGILLNPLFWTEDFIDETKTTRVLSNAYIDYEIIPDLTLRVSAGGNLFNLKRNTYQGGLRLSGNEISGEASVGSLINPQWLNENTLTYDKKINENHHLNILGGFSAQGSLTESLVSFAQGFPNDVVAFNNLSTASTFLPPRTDKSLWTLASFIGRVNYQLMNKYLFTATIRADGSSRFGEGNKWGYFPSGAFAWRVIEEGFMQNQDLITEMKIRTSYGVTGNQEIGTYQSLSAFTSVQYPFGDQAFTGFAIDRVANPDLRWETTAQFDIGMDMGMFNNRLNFTADYYHRRTTDLLFEVALPFSTGFNSSLQNLGEIVNRGVELSLGANILTGGLTWSMNGNISFNRNEIIDLGVNDQIIVPIDRDAEASVLRVGEPIGSFFGFEYIGNIQLNDDVSSLATFTGLDQPGDPLYRDVNNDGLLNSDDRVILGNAQPDYIWGLTNNFSFKNFELSVFIHGVEGNSIYSSPIDHATNLTFGNQHSIVKQRWTPDNPSNVLPRANALPAATLPSPLIVQDGSFVRIRNINFGYNVPASLLNEKIRSLRVYASATNWFTFTDYLGYDPEVGSFGQNALAQGVDWGTYPPAKTFILGFNIGL